MKSLQFTIISSQFSINYQLSIINVATWKMASGKYLVNGKRKMVNASGGDD